MNERKKKKNENQGVVYKVKCWECNSIHIGETGRKLKTRLEEQKKDAN